MPSRRSSASKSPRFPLVRQASASLTMRSLSAALKTRRVFFGTVSRVAPLGRACRRSLSGEGSRSGIRDGFGTICDPFSAHRYLGFAGELSHTTLARGVPAAQVAAAGHDELSLDGRLPDEQVEPGTEWVIDSHQRPRCSLRKSRADVVLRVSIGEIRS